MKKSPWYKILICVGWLLLVAGIVPGVYVLARLGGTHHPKVLSVPVSLKQGEFVSPVFTADGSGDYAVELNWGDFPARQTDVELDWKIEAENGSVIEQGTYSDILRGANTVSLGQYKPTAGQREKAVLDIHQDVNGTSANTKLEIGPPSAVLDASYAIPFAAGWAAFVGGPGALLLIVLVIAHRLRREKPAVAKRK